MSTQAATEFLAKVATDELLQKQLTSQGGDPKQRLAAMVATGRQHGFQFEEDEVMTVLKAAKGGGDAALEERELALVAGGMSPRSATSWGPSGSGWAVPRTATMAAAEASPASAADGASLPGAARERARQRCPARLRHHSLRSRRLEDAMTIQPRSRAVALAVVLTASLGLACGDDPTGPTPTTIVGSWVATSLTAPSQPQWGDGVADDGLSIGMTFGQGGSYTLDVSDDDPADPWLCPGAASCSYSGSYTTSGNTVVFDGGTADEASATYTLSGGRLTIVYTATATNTDPLRLVFRSP
jgi:predicted ribosomally synthesized peptide with nif11-like leader